MQNNFKRPLGKGTYKFGHLKTRQQIQSAFGYH